MVRVAVDMVIVSSVIALDMHEDQEQMKGMMNLKQDRVDRGLGAFIVNLGVRSQKILDKKRKPLVYDDNMMMSYGRKSPP